MLLRKLGSGRRSRLLTWMRRNVVRRSRQEEVTYRPSPVAPSPTAAVVTTFPDTSATASGTPATSMSSSALGDNGVVAPSAVAQAGRVSSAGDRLDEEEATDDTNGHDVGDQQTAVCVKQMYDDGRCPDAHRDGKQGRAKPRNQERGPHDGGFIAGVTADELLLSRTLWKPSPCRGP